MKAIDIVIIPPEPVMSEAIRVSGLVAGKHIRLNKGTQLPHISLLMGGMSPDRESEVLERIQKISGMFKSIPLSINEIRIKSSYTGLHLVRSDELFELHRTLVSDVMPLLDYAVPLHAVADADQALPKTLEWIQGFPENSSNENFDPHITLGDARLDSLESITLPIEFEVSDLALYHLGNLCTCHTLLKTFS